MDAHLFFRFCEELAPRIIGGFHLFMRIYTPDMEALKTWTAPTITAIG